MVSSSAAAAASAAVATNASLMEMKLRNHVNLTMQLLVSTTVGLPPPLLRDNKDNIINNNNNNINNYYNDDINNNNNNNIADNIININNNNNHNNHNNSSQYEQEWAASDSINGNESILFYPLVKQPAYMIAIFAAAYGLVLVLALLGNACVLAVVIKDKRFHSATYIFIANLAVADLLVAIFCNPINLLTNIFNGWRFGAFMCKAAPYLQGVSVCASVNTLAAIAVDRYLAICHVLRIRMTMRMARIILGVVWTVALTIFVPWAVFYHQQTFNLPSQSIPICVQAWPDPKQSGEFFLGAIFLFCYAIPLSFIVCCYFLIGWRVWNRDAPGITTERGVIQKSKIRVVKMLAVVVLLFALSWLPLYVVNLIIHFFHPGDDSVEMQIIHDSVIPVAQWLGTSNSCMNPLVYCLFSKRIRERIRLMITCSSRSFDSRRTLTRYSSTRHMTVDYCNGQVKLAFRSSVSPNRLASLACQAKPMLLVASSADNSEDNVLNNSDTAVTIT